MNTPWTCCSYSKGSVRDQYLSIRVDFWTLTCHTENDTSDSHSSTIVCLNTLISSIMIIPGNSPSVVNLASH